MHNVAGSWIHLNMLLVFRVCIMETHIFVNDVPCANNRITLQTKETEMHGLCLHIVIYSGSPSVRDTIICIMYIVNCES